MLVGREAIYRECFLFHARLREVTLTDTELRFEADVLAGPWSSWRESPSPVPLITACTRLDAAAIEPDEWGCPSVPWRLYLDPDLVGAATAAVARLDADASSRDAYRTATAAIRRHFRPEGWEALFRGVSPGSDEGEGEPR